MEPYPVFLFSFFPPNMSNQLYAGLAAIALALWYAKSQEKKRLLPSPPPGPKPHFLLGNVLDFPYENPWAVYNEWKKQYGDVVYINLLGQPMLILNSLEACQDLLDKRSAKYSDRPRLVMVNELMGWFWNTALMHYSPRWRAHRRMFHQYFNEHASLEYRPCQEKHAHILLRRLLQTPDQFLDHIRLLFAASIMDVVYDIKVEDHDDVFVRTAEAAMHGVSVAGNPGTFMVDTLPILKYVPSWMPGAGFQKQAKEWSIPTGDMNRLPFEYVKRNMQAGKAGPSIMASMLSRCDEEGKTVIEEGVQLEESMEDIARNAAAVSYVGGSDTTLSTIQTFFLAMAMFPESQKAGQDQLDAVVGGDRLPTYEDLEQLPFISAIMKECLRWQNVLPLGVAHCLTEDDEYRGWHIPKGTIVMPNAWSILHDPEVYPDPHRFNPWRWLKEDGTLNPAVPDADTAAFGFGRRICPGRHFAMHSLYIIVSNVLASFRISAPLDEKTGKPVVLEGKVMGALLSYPEPYKVDIVPRSAKAAQLVRDSELR